MHYFNDNALLCIVNGIVPENAPFPFHILAEDAANEDFIIQE